MKTKIQGNKLSFVFLFIAIIGFVFFTSTYSAFLHNERAIHTTAKIVLEETTKTMQIANVPRTEQTFTVCSKKWRGCIPVSENLVKKSPPNQSVYITNFTSKETQNNFIQLLLFNLNEEKNFPPFKVLNLNTHSTSYGIQSEAIIEVKEGPWKVNKMDLSITLPNVFLKNKTGPDVVS